MDQPALRVIAVVMLCSLVLPLLARRPKHAPEQPQVTLPERKAA